MQTAYFNPVKRSVGKIIVALGRLLSVFDPLLAVPSYFRLRSDILGGMPWTVRNLRPLITPYQPGERLSGNGYTSAMVQANGFNLIVYRQSQQGRDDDSFSIASPCCPGALFPFGVVEAAVLELEGARPLKIRQYDTIADVDQSLRNLSGLLKAHLSCELFFDTRAVVERMLKEEMLEATTPR
jgi:hypothetical protein